MWPCVRLKAVISFHACHHAYRFVPRHSDELCLETDDPVLILNQSEDLWCHGYNMRTGVTGIFPAFYAIKVAKEMNQGTL